ncbi:MAG: diacylglycerol/lipid kinase family protein [Petrotogales bacterium]
MKTLVVVNPAASAGRSIKDYKNIIEKLLHKYLGDFSVKYTSGVGDAARFAYKGERFDRVICVGGDGTLNELVNGLHNADLDIPIGLVSVGTGNDFKKTLGLVGSYEYMIQRIASGEPKEFDLLEATYKGLDGKMITRLAVNIIGVGFDAAVSQRINDARFKVRGKMSYVISFLPEFITTGTYPVHFSTNGNFTQKSYYLIAFGNGKYFGGGMKVCPGAVPDDGFIDAVGIGGMTKLRLLYHFPKIYKGTHISVNEVDHARGKEFDVKGEKETPIEMDGEVVGTLPLKVKIKEKALKILL